MTRDIIVSNRDFTQYLTEPLVADDVQAYRVVYKPNFDVAGTTFQVTATRQDGKTIVDAGTVENGTGYYILKNNMYSVVGETRLRLTFVNGMGTVLTTKEVICPIAEPNGEADATGDDRVPILTALISQSSGAIAYANNAAIYANTQGDYVKDILDSIQSGFAIKIAASDASDESKAVAKYVCDGINDEEQFNLALADLPNGGCIELSEGTFVCNGEINDFNYDITLKGQGLCTIINNHESPICIKNESRAIIKDCQINLIYNRSSVVISACKCTTVENLDNVSTLKISNSEISGLYNVGTVQLSNSKVEEIYNTASGGRLLLNNNIIVTLFTKANIIPPTTADIQKVNKVNTIEFM